MVNLLHFASILALGSATTVYGSPTSIDSIIPVLSNISFSDSTKDDDKMCSSQSWERKIFPSPPECDVRLWVRSEDLRPSTVVEGDVRLFNNLTARSLEECNILSWSLGLRLKERGAFQYLTGRPRRPDPPPGLNLTKQVDDDEDVDQDISFNSDQMVFGSIKETVRDEGRELRKQWDLDLEKWVEQVREWEDEKAHYALENETTVFSSFLDMGRPESTPMDGEPSQHQISSFGVAVPSTNFMPQIIKNGESWNSGRAIETISEARMYYFAQVLLSNGSTIKIDGGSANFLPLPQTEQALSLSKDEDANIPTISQKHDLTIKEEGFNQYSSGDGDLTWLSQSQEKVEKGSGWKLELNMPSNASFVQGRNYTLSGRIVAPSNGTTEARLPVVMSLRLMTTSFDHWPIDVFTETLDSEKTLDIDVDLAYSGVPLNATETLAKAALAIHDDESFWTLPKQKITAIKLEELLEGNVKAYRDEDDWEMEDWEDDLSNGYGEPRLYSFQNETLSELQTDSRSKWYNFEVQLSVPKNVVPSHTTSFKTVTSSLRFTLKTVKSSELACLHLEVLKEKNIKPSRSELQNCELSHNDQHSEFNHELSKWIPHHHKLKGSSELWEKLFKSKDCNSWGDAEDGQLQGSCPQKNIDISIVPRIWNEEKRTLELERKVSASELSKKKSPPFHYSKEATHARAPVLIRGSKEELLKAVDSLVEESQLHEFLRSSAAEPVNFKHLDSFFSTISTAAKSNLTTHHLGIDKFKRDGIKGKLGAEHLIPKAQNQSELDDEKWRFNFNDFRITFSKLNTAGTWEFPAKKGSAALDIGLAWAENVMVELIRGRKVNGK